MPRVTNTLTPYYLVGMAILAVLLVGQPVAGAGRPDNRKPKPDRASPSITIIDPESGATVSGRVVVTGTATDNVQVSRVEVSVDGEAFRAASGTTSWSFAVDTTVYADGEHTVTSRAIDGSSNSATATGTLEISNEPLPPEPVPDTTPPSLEIVAPQAGSTVGGTVSVTGTATDNVGVARVEVSVDGGASRSAVGTANWSYALDSTALSDGTHRIQVVATDASGNAYAKSTDVTVRNSAPPPAGPQELVTPEGVKIQVAADVTGWTPQKVYDLLKPNAYQLALLGPSLTVKVQTQYSSQTASSSSQSGGVTTFRATIYLQSTGGSTFDVKPDWIVAHEYGHAWTTYHLHMSQGGSWTKYLDARGLSGDPRVNTTYNWSTGEMAADDYRMLFGTAAAISQSGYINPDAPDPRTVAGLRDFFTSVWSTM